MSISRLLRRGPAEEGKELQDGTQHQQQKEVARVHRAGTVFHVHPGRHGHQPHRRRALRRLRRAVRGADQLWHHRTRTRRPALRHLGRHPVRPHGQEDRHGRRLRDLRRLRLLWRRRQPAALRHAALLCHRCGLGHHQHRGALHPRRHVQGRGRARQVRRLVQHRHVRYGRHHGLRRRRSRRRRLDPCLLDLLHLHPRPRHARHLPAEHEAGQGQRRG